jgi:hypothetical protein
MSKETGTEEETGDIGAGRTMGGDLTMGVKEEVADIDGTVGAGREGSVNRVTCPDSVMDIDGRV